MPKRKYSRKHRGGGGQCSSLGCKDDEIPDSNKIVMANNFLRHNYNKYDYTQTNNKNTEIYISVLQKIYKIFPEGIDGNTKLVAAFKKPEVKKDQNLFESNCNMFRDNLLDRLKTGYMKELEEDFSVVLSVVERKLITQESKGNFKKEFNENKAAAEEKEMQRLEMQRLEMQRLEKERQAQEKERQEKKNPFTQNRKTHRKTDRDTRRNIIENKFGVVLSTAHNKSQNSRQPK